MHSALSGFLGCVVWGTGVCVPLVVPHSVVSQERVPQRGTSGGIRDGTPQERPHAATSQTASDSVRAFQAARAARKAQTAFETFRIRNLPRLQSGPDTPCDEKVGRFCYWHREGDSLVAEPSKISRERERFITRLDHLTALAPHDDWIAGQRVRYLVEAKYDSSALLAAIECKGTPWWCQGLRGFALHAMQRYEAAGAVFDSMLAAMPAIERCRWTDVSLLLSETERSAYTRIPCTARADFEDRFWQLADPSYVVAGNDRRTEHFSRFVMSTLLKSSSNAYGLVWGEDMHELLMRYGIPTSFTTSWPSSYTYSFWDTPVTGHEREPCFHFVALYPGSDSTRWDLHASRARERYSPLYIETLSDIRAQSAMFKRGDSALVIVAYEDSSPAPLTIGITGARAARSSDSTHRDSMRTDSLYGDMLHHRDTLVRSSNTLRFLQTYTPWRGISVGIERFDALKRHIAQHRSWLIPPARGLDAPQLSTLLLFASTDSTTTQTLESAIRSALTTNDVTGRRTLGIYWEMYEMTADSTTQTLSVTVTITRIDSDFRRWLAQTLRLTPRDVPFGVGWQEVPGTANVLYKSITLDLSQLQRGTYQIEVAIGEAPHRSTTSRQIRLR